MATLDDSFRLVGDEDCGVGIDCRMCDRGGAPVAYYAGIAQYYTTNDDVVPVETIDALLEAAHQHLRDHHAA